jgi:hypothetical protein
MSNHETLEKHESGKEGPFLLTAVRFLLFAKDIP